MAVAAEKGGGGEGWKFGCKLRANSLECLPEAVWGEGGRNWHHHNGNQVSQGRRVIDVHTSSCPTVQLSNCPAVQLSISASVEEA